VSQSVEAACQAHEGRRPSYFFAPASYHEGSRDRQKSDVTLALLKEAGIEQADCVVDIGCGAGQTLRLVRKEAPRALLVGIDPDIAAFAAGIGDPDGLHLVCGEGERLPLADRMASHVICRVALNYMDQRMAIEEMARILRPGGYLILSCIGPGYALQQVIRPAHAGWRQRLGNLKDFIAGLLLHCFGWQGRRGTFWGRSVPYTPLRWLCQQLLNRDCMVRRHSCEGRFLRMATITWMMFVRNQ
jgi:SAM-dependent methyltransferase